ncbi:nucleoside hydrolase-like domain-containing protein [Shivajiella indica]|uniref:Nucleoside hydrolase-like domain-containing protein n=1 Tax=Shivajiella indica TaxID=872115 RepID=A0ABW5BF69_9BACT
MLPVQSIRACFLNHFALAVVLLFMACQSSDSEQTDHPSEKIRTVILTDMTHDDGNSLIRYLYYGSYFDLEALIITNQLPDYIHDDPGPWNKAMSVLHAYREELPQLHKHDPGLPSYEDLMAVTRQGRGALPIIWLTNTLEFSNNIADRYVTSSWDSIYYHDWIGEGLTPHGEPKDSEGSDFLVRVFEKEDDRPIFIQAWGGTITFVQALHRFREKHGEEKFQQLLPKLNLFGILFQDISFEFFADFVKMQEETCAEFGTAIPTYGEKPVELGMVLYDNGHFWHYVWSRDPNWKKPIGPSDVNGHGPMSEIYDNGGEGDSPSFFYLLSSVFGLNDPLDPTQGSWGSRFQQMGEGFPKNYYYTCGIEQTELSRWDEAVTNNFKNRLLWSTKEPGEVNREPLALVNGNASKETINLKVKPGEKVKLDANASKDPDGDPLSFQWFRYDLADTYEGEFQISNPQSPVQEFSIPEDLGSKNIHLILEVKDRGEPYLVSYRRVIISAR